MKLIHLEDDPLYADYIRLELIDFAAAERKPLDVHHIPTERKFVEQIDDLVAEGDAFLLDVMVRWSRPEDDWGETGLLKAPPGEYYDAGLRCAKLLLEKLPNNYARRILLYTVYQRDEIQEEFSTLQKVKGIHSLKILTKGEEIEEVWKVLSSSVSK